LGALGCHLANFDYGLVENAVRKVEEMNKDVERNMKYAKSKPKSQSGSGGRVEGVFIDFGIIYPLNGK
jgi:hypothetical protein